MASKRHIALMNSMIESESAVAKTASKTVDRTRSMAKTIQKSTDEIFLSSKDIFSTANNQAASVQEIESTINENTQITVEIADKTSSVAAIASRMANDVIHGFSVLERNVEQMENIPVFSGIVLNEDYEMISVLYIPTVIKMAKRIKTIDFKKRNTEFEKLRKSILVVDDSLPVREIENEILKMEGYLVDTAADGAQALKATKNKRYDLICTDINMPVMDGFMLTENIKKNKELSHIPVIVISSKSS
jgi:hypothetical protein